MSSKGRMIGIHQLELKPGVTTDQFEQFLASEFQHQRTPLGWKTSILKGGRGERTGRYALMFEIDSAELLERYMPATGGVSAEYEHWMAQQSPAEAEFDKQLFSMVSGFGEHFTDYVVIAEETDS